MDDYKLYTDKSSLFECRIELEGASLSNAQARLVVETSNGMGLIFNGKNQEKEVEIKNYKIKLYEIRCKYQEESQPRIKVVIKG